MHEFSIIETYFAKPIDRPDIRKGIGDDSAIVTIPEGCELAITTDTLVADVHFYKDTLPYDIGFKALAVNLSDLAAMGAKPSWFTLALTLPSANEKWLKNFCDGLFALASQYQIALIGGDLTQGPLSITIQAMGYLPVGKALLRSGAKPRDLIYVTGTLGDAGLGLEFLRNKIDVPASLQDTILLKLHRPEPRVAAGLALLPLASAAIDISDGLAADLKHILSQSQVGAVVYVDQLPLSEAMLQVVPSDTAYELALTAGDDYELCFTVPADKKFAVEKSLTQLNCPFICIGMITEQTGFELRYTDGNIYHGAVKGYQHF